MADALEALDLPAWVDGAPDRQRNFREAVHIILTAIGTSTALRSTMIMKGGMLMAIRYESTRFTKDADFSTQARFAKGDDEAMLKELDQQITLCRRRSNIDHSYNEAVFDVEVLRFSDGDSICAYSFTNLVAEKLRSLLQQPVRRRNREQDVYDLHLLIGMGHPLSAEERHHLVKLITDSCTSRNIAVDARALRNPEVRAMAEKGYANLQPTIEGRLSPFNEAYAVVQDFFEALPWTDSLLG